MLVFYKNIYIFFLSIFQIIYHALCFIYSSTNYIFLIMRILVVLSVYNDRYLSVFAGASL